ncbi:MAG: hypothetical protein JKY93_12575 [Gammaproteobacteria bacterium]|nr:hypothetical protein [Gammaproteobacteria bacterium]
MIKFLLSFVGGNKVLLIALLFSSVASAGGAWKIADWKHGKQIAEMKNAAWQAHVDSLNQKNEIDHGNRQVAKAVAEAYELRNRKREIVTRYINKEVIKYVQSDIAGKCDLPDKWVQLHDDAAKNSNTGHADTSGQLNGPPSRITDIEVLGTASVNYDLYHQVSDQLIEMQKWARGIRCENHG